MQNTMPICAQMDRLSGKALHAIQNIIKDGDLSLMDALARALPSCAAILPLIAKSITPHYVMKALSQHNGHRFAPVIIDLAQFDESIIDHPEAATAIMRACKRITFKEHAQDAGLALLARVITSRHLIGYPVQSDDGSFALYPARFAKQHCLCASSIYFAALELLFSARHAHFNVLLNSGLFDECFNADNPLPMALCLKHFRNDYLLEIKERFGIARICIGADLFAKNSFFTPMIMELARDGASIERDSLEFYVDATCETVGGRACFDEVVELLAPRSKPISALVLGIVARFGTPRSLCALLDAGVDCSQTFLGRSALRAVLDENEADKWNSQSRVRSVVMAYMLVERGGASPYVRDCDGQSALDVACCDAARDDSRLEFWNFIRRFNPATVLLRATCARIGASSPAQLLAGFPHIARFIVGVAGLPWFSEDLP